MKTATVILATLVVVVALVPSGCGQKQFTIENGKLLAGGDSNIPPFITVEGGKPVGYSVDLCGEMAKRMGLTSEIVPALFKNFVTDLNSGKFDIIGQPLAISPEREKGIDLSTPYFVINQAIFVPKGSPAKSEGDLAGKVVGVKAGTTAQGTAEGIKGVKQVRAFDTHEIGIDALVKGQIDAYIGYAQTTSIISEKTGKTVMAAEIGAPEPCGIGVKKGNTELLDRVNEALGEMKKDGTLDKLEEKWFGGGG